MDKILFFTLMGFLFILLLLSLFITFLENSTKHELELSKLHVFEECIKSHDIDKCAEILNIRKNSSKIEFKVSTEKKKKEEFQY